MEKKTREFWIDALSADKYGWMQATAHEATEAYDPENMSHLIPVIEKSAYDELLKRQLSAAQVCSSLKVENDNLKEEMDAEGILICELDDKLEILQAKADKLAEALENEKCSCMPKSGFGERLFCGRCKALAEYRGEK